MLDLLGVDVRRAGWVWIALGLGCGPVVGQEGSTSGSTTSIDPSTTSPTTTVATTTTSTSTSTTSTSTTSDPTDADTSTSGDTDGTFIMDPSAGDLDITCDEWAQDCPEGEKCMPWANDGSMAWN